jgi:hypothetical protein
MHDSIGFACETVQTFTVDHKDVSVLNSLNTKAVNLIQLVEQNLHGLTSNCYRFRSCLDFERSLAVELCAEKLIRSSRLPSADIAQKGTTRGSDT